MPDIPGKIEVKWRKIILKMESENKMSTEPSCSLEHIDPLLWHLVTEIRIINCPIARTLIFRIILTGGES